MRQDLHAPAPSPELLEALLDAVRHRRPVALCTVVSVRGSAPQQVGARMLVLPEGEPIGTVGGGALEWEIIQDARERLANGDVSGLHDVELAALDMGCGGGMSVFIDVMVPRERVIIFGAGHVGRALAHAMGPLGFHVVVVDDRPEWADASLLPGAGEVIARPFAEFVEDYEPRRDDYLVIVTRGHEHDEALLRGLVGAPVAYLGMMGSKNKVRRLVGRLREEGVAENILNAIDTPLGLPIGAVTPAEIAVSIAARLIATRRDADAGLLGRGKDG